MRYATMMVAVVLLAISSGCHTGYQGHGRGGLLGFGLLGNNTPPGYAANGTQYAPPAPYQTPPQYAQVPPAVINAPVAAQPQVIAAQPQIVAAAPTQQPIYVQQLPTQQMVQPTTYYTQGNACQPVCCTPCE